MSIKILFNYRDERTQGECVIRANGPDTKDHGGHVDIKSKKKKKKDILKVKLRGRSYYPTVR